MDEDRKKLKGKEALDEIEARLGGLLGNFGATLKDVIDIAQSIEARGSGQTEYSSNLSNGPLKAQSTVRFRVGGIGDEAVQSDRDITQPVNSPPAMNEQHKYEAVREPFANIYLSGENWVLTAEMPGVPEGAVDIETKGNNLEINAKGRVCYATSVPIPEGLDAESLSHTLTNGVLELRGKIIKSGDGA